MANEIPLDILVRLDKSINDIQKFREKTESSLKSIQKSAEAISFVEIGKTAVEAGKLIVEALKDVIHSALESEKAINQLRSTLKLTGSETEENVKLFTELATEIENITGISDEAVLGQISYVKALGATNTQTEKIIRAATDLKAVLGGDLQSNIDILIKTFSGEVPRSISRVLPELHKFSTAQLQSGAAVDFLANKYKGFQSELSKTSGVQIEILKQKFDDLKETIGGLVTNSSLFKSAIEGVKNVTTNIDEGIKEIPKHSTEFKDEMLKVVPIVGNIYHFLNKGKIEIEREASAAGSVNEFVKEIYKNAVKVEEKGGLGLEKAKKNIEEIAAKAKALHEQLKNVGLTPQSALDRERAERIKIIDDARKHDKISAQEAADERIKIEKDFQEKSLQLRIKKTKDFLALNLLDEKGNVQLPTSDIQGAALGVGAASQAAKGVEGARGILKTGATIGGTALFGPEAGQVIGQITELLSQSPEQLKASLESFFQAIPVLIENIIENIPLIMQTFAEQTPIIIDKIISDLPRILQAQIENVPKLFAAMAAEAPKIAISLANKMPEVAVEFAVNLIKSIPSIVKEFVNQIKGQLGGLLGSNEGGGNGLIGGAKAFLTGGLSKVFKFADGGIVPSGFPNDSAPALLTSGEIVLNKDGVDNMISAFNSLANRRPTESNGSQNISINLQVGEKQLADVLLQLNRNGFRTV